MTEEEKIAGGEGAADSGRKEKKGSSGSAFEGTYDRLPDISLKSLDLFIAACVIALVAVVVIGVLRARHVI